MSKPIGIKDFKHRFAVSVCRVPESRPLCRDSRLLCAFLFGTLPRCWFWPARTIELYSSSVGGSNKTKLKSCKLLMEHYAMHVCLPVPVCLSVSLFGTLSSVCTPIRLMWLLIFALLYRMQIHLFISLCRWFSSTVAAVAAASVTSSPLSPVLLWVYRK